MSILISILNKFKQLLFVIITFFLFIFIGEDLRKKDNSDMLDKEN